MPGTPPLLVHCQKVHVPQPAGSVGDGCPGDAIQSGSVVKAVLLPVHWFHQRAAV